MADIDDLRIQTHAECVEAGNASRMTVRLRHLEFAEAYKFRVREMDAQGHRATTKLVGVATRLPATRGPRSAGCLDFQIKSAQNIFGSKKRILLRFVASVFACLSAIATVPANAAYVISLDTVSAGGTLTTIIDNISCVPGPCSTTVAPYETLVDGRYSSLTIESLNGLFSYNGVDRSRGFYNVIFEFANGTLLSTQLTGSQALSAPCTIGPCNQVYTTFAASSFPLRVFDEATESSSLVAPVPELGTWAMMLLGFLGAGLAIRRWRAYESICRLAPALLGCSFSAT